MNESEYKKTPQRHQKYVHSLFNVNLFFLEGYLGQHLYNHASFIKALQSDYRAEQL